MGFLFNDQPLLDRAKQGDRAAREKLIEKYLSFVIAASSRIAGRYLVQGKDEEISIGLIALNEAIDHYQPGKGANFKTFAETVIRRRLIDFWRKNGQQQEIPITALEGDAETETSAWTVIEAKTAETAYNAQNVAAERREEIARYTVLLQEYGITFSELINVSPRHNDARQHAMAAARVIAANPLYRSYLLHKKSLPLKELSTEVTVSRKTLERQRKYIIAITLILIEEFTYLREYIKI